MNTDASYSDPDERRQLAREAKAIIALALRNGPIENAHAGKICPICESQPGCSRITDAEMKAIMKNALDRLYTLLCLKSEDSVGYERQIKFGERYTTRADDPNWSDSLLNSELQ
jgi:hypothetical protein